MANRRRQGQFYDPAAAKALQAVPIPEKLKCGRCNKFLSQSRFSANQLNAARSAVKYQGPHARYHVKCQSCSGQQIHEIKCCMCQKTKGLEAFAKSQRTKPDEAECYACIEDRLAQDAVNEEVYDGTDRSKAFAPTESNDGNFPSIWTAPTTATESSQAGDEWQDDKALDDDSEGGGISFSVQDFARKVTMSSGADQETLIETEYDRSSEVNGVDDWQTVPTKSWHTKSNNTPSTSSGFDPSKYGKPPTRSSSGSVSGSVHTFSSDYAERDSTSYKNGWAKIPAYDARKDTKKQPFFGPAEPAPTEEWSSDEDEEDGGDYDSDDDSDTEI